MKIDSKQNPYKSQKIENMVRSINARYLSIDSIKKTVSPPIAFMSEDILSKTTSLEPDVLIWVWLKRMERYFSNATEFKNPKDTKSETGKMLGVFPIYWVKFSDKLKDYTLEDPLVLNCFILSMLLCIDREAWVFVIDYINASPKVETSIKILLNWMFETGFLTDKNTVEYNNDTIARLTEGTQGEFSLPDSPISKLFSFLVIAKLVSEGGKTEIGNHCFIPTRFLDKGPLKMYEYFITQAFCVSYLVDKVYIHQLLQHFCRRFCLTCVDTVGGAWPEYLRGDKEYKHFLDGFVQASMENPDYLVEVLELVGLSRIMRASGIRDDLPFLKQYLRPCTRIAKLLLNNNYYAEAFHLIDDLSAISRAKIVDKQRDQMLFLYSICYRMNDWLTGVSSGLNLLSWEQQLYKRVAKQTFVYDAPELKFLQSIALELVKKHNASSDWDIKTKCRDFFLIVKPHLSSVGKGIEAQFIIQPYIEDSAPKKKKTRKKTSDKTNKTELLPIPTETPLAALDLFRQEKIDTMMPQLTFFTPPKETLVARKWHIKKEQIPEEVLKLVDSLRKKFPKISLRLGGGAIPELLLSESKPKDWDIAVKDTVSIYHIQMHLDELKVTCKRQSVRYPILFCKLQDGSHVDFMNKGDDNNPFFRADFNLAGLYCDLDGTDLMEVKSYDKGSLESFEKKRISDVYETGVELFQRDPVRLFRLVKYLIKYPEFEVDASLERAIKKLRPDLVKIIEHYLKKKDNASRLDKVIRDIFERFSLPEINEALMKLNILDIVTNCSIKSLEHVCYNNGMFIEPKNRLITWLVGNAGLMSTQKKFNHPFVKWVRWTVFENSCLDFASGSSSRYFTDEVKQLVQKSLSEPEIVTLTLK